MTGRVWMRRMASTKPRSSVQRRKERRFLIRFDRFCFVLEANPYPKGSAEALRYNAARLELARLRSLGRMPPPSLMKEVAEGVKVATVGLAVAHPKPKASPAPWLAARTLFAKPEEADGKQIKKLGTSELSELSKSIAEERKKLRLFVVKAFFEA